MEFLFLCMVLSFLLVGAVSLVLWIPNFLHLCLTLFLSGIMKLKSTSPILYEYGGWNQLCGIQMRFGLTSVSIRRIKIVYLKLHCDIDVVKVVYSSTLGPIELKVKELQLSVSLKACTNFKLQLHLDAHNVKAHRSSLERLATDSLSLSFQLQGTGGLVVRNLEILCRRLNLKFTEYMFLKLTQSSTNGIVTSALSTNIPQKVMQLLTVVEKYYPCFLKEVYFTLTQLIVECVNEDSISHVHGCTGVYVTMKKDIGLEVNIAMSDVNVVEATASTNFCIANVDFYAFVYSPAQLARTVLNLHKISSYLALEEVATITTFTARLEEFDKVMVYIERMTIFLSVQQYQLVLKLFAKPNEAEVKDWEEWLELVPLELSMKTIAIFLLADRPKNGITMSASGLQILGKKPYVKMITKAFEVRNTKGSDLILSRCGNDDTNMASVSLFSVSSMTYMNVDIQPIRIQLSKEVKAVMESYLNLSADSREKTPWGISAWLKRKKTDYSHRVWEINIREVELEVTLHGFWLNLNKKKFFIDSFYLPNFRGSCGEVLHRFGKHFHSQVLLSVTRLKTKRSAEKRRQERQQLQEIAVISPTNFGGTDWSGFPEAVPLPVWPDTPQLPIEELLGVLGEIPPDLWLLDL